MKFIGTPEYISHKASRFRGQDELIIKNNPAFIMDKPEIKKLYSEEFRKKSAIYFGKQPIFDEIIQRIHAHIEIL